jgi:tRNA-2-methylthio-N6-dimethylallyladenosine synthase
MSKKPKDFTFSIQVFGCQMNYVDAEIIVSTLTARGGLGVLNTAEADLIIVVSCGVRAAAEERIVNWCKKIKNQNLPATLVLTGCLSHRQDIRKRLADAVDWFVPIEHWTSQIDDIIPRKKAPVMRQDFYCLPAKHSSNFRAYIPIATGCNNFCSYCVVPYARGKERSIAPEQILTEAKKLIKNGYKEIYLLGQNVNNYHGIDPKGEKWTFSRLLQEIDKIPGKFWIRFISSHPKDITPEFIKTLPSCKKVSPNLHLPIQSGSNRVLKRMNRHYTREDYLKLITSLRQSYPQIVFSTDIIVGFPGETERDFQDSLALVKKVGYEMLFSLKYSPRPETAAFKLRDSVPAATKIARQRELDATWEKIAQAKNQRFVGQLITILVDRIKTKTAPNGQSQSYLLGKSFENKDVQAVIKPGSESNLVGNWAQILIKDANALALRGELVEAKK